MYTRKILSRIYTPSGFDETLTVALAAQLPRLLEHPGVLGAGLGMRTRKLELLAESEPCLVVYVRRKKAPRTLASSQRLPRRLEGVAVDVVEMAPQDQHVAAGAVVGIGPGATILVDQVGSATAGALVQDSEGQSLLLTAGHALYGRRSFKAGVSVRAPAANGSSKGSLIGRTHDVHFGLDAGLVKLDAMPASNRTTCDGQRIGAPVDAVVGAILEKCGAVSGVTQSVVSSIGRVGRLFPVLTLAPVDLDMDPLSSDGDSGSVWYDATTRGAVGLHVQGSAATSRRKEYGLATLLSDVLGAFGVQWV